MKNARIIAAACIAAAAIAGAAHAQKPMYRCGSNYQDHPCEGGQPGRVIGDTGAPRPAAPAASPNAYSPGGQGRGGISPYTRENLLAQDCQTQRRLGSRMKNQRDKERNQAELRRMHCAPVGQGLGNERKCAEARGEEEITRECKEFATVMGWR
jgi:hypothetical protein